MPTTTSQKALLSKQTMEQQQKNQKTTSFFNPKPFKKRKLSEGASIVISDEQNPIQPKKKAS